MTFSQMLRISMVLPLLLVISVFVVALALERFWALWNPYSRLPGDLWERAAERLARGDKAGAAEACRRSENMVAEALARLLGLHELGMERVVETFQLYRHRMQMEWSRRVGFFGTISFISPLIGLMGTVLGIIRAFHDLAAAGAGGPAVVAAGISEALVATAAGIGVAVASAVLYNYFTLAVRHRLNTVDLWVFELVELAGRAQHPQAPPPPKHR